MAGMLPGVESARRRRFHGNGGWSESPLTYGYGSTRRFYMSNCDSNLTSSSSLLRRMVKQEEQDAKLGGAAREAKERLDERLRAQWKPETKRTKLQEKVVLGAEEHSSMVLSDLQIEVYGLKKSGSKRFSWGKLGWKASDQDECAVCLDHFKAGQTLMHLPCAHRFHLRCLAPWLENNAHCPCCRMVVLT
ncbi:hypothetical protein LguiA_011169 [Lonicera macranthoides]